MRFSITGRDGKAVMGLWEVLTCLEEGLVDSLIVSSDSKTVHEGLRRVK